MLFWAGAEAGSGGAQRGKEYRDATKICRSRVWYQVKQHGKSLEGLGEQTVGGRIDREVNGLGRRIDREVNRINREVNGLGQRINELKKEADERYLALCLVVLCHEKKEEVAKLLLNWKRP